VAGAAGRSLQDCTATAAAAAAALLAAVGCSEGSLKHPLPVGAEDLGMAEAAAAAVAIAAVVTVAVAVAALVPALVVW